MAKDQVAFSEAYGDNLPVYDQFSGNLDLNGETLTLFRPDPIITNQEIVVNRVHYETTQPWPTITNGAALQLVDSGQDNSRVANWTAVTPPLSRAKVFSVYIYALPQFSSVNSLNNGQIQISFGTLPAQNYQLQYKNNLNDPLWTALGGSIPGDGSNKTVSDEIGAQPQRFYRLLAMP